MSGSNQTWVLYYFNGTFEVRTYQAFKMHWEELGAEFIKESDDFDELYELSQKVVCIEFEEE